LFGIYMWNAPGVSEKEKFEKVKQIAGKMMSLAPNRPESRVAFSWSKYVEGDWVGAEEQILRALSLDSNYSHAHSIYCYYLSLLGRVEEAKGHGRRAQEQEPTSRTAATIAGYPYIDARPVTNAGTINVTSSYYIPMQNNATLTNSGMIDFQGDGGLYGPGLDDGGVASQGLGEGRRGRAHQRQRKVDHEESAGGDADHRPHGEDRDDPERDPVGDMHRAPVLPGREQQQQREADQAAGLNRDIQRHSNPSDASAGARLGRLVALPRHAPGRVAALKIRLDVAAYTALEIRLND